MSSATATPPPGPSPGPFRRLIDLRREDGRRVVGWLEDEFHHFGLTLVHEQGRVLEVRAEAVRSPWTTCPAAEIPLRALIGQPIPARASTIGALIDMRLQCTHLFDLAGLLLAHIAAGRQHRRYELVVDQRELLAQDGLRLRYGVGRARLWRDGQLALCWGIEGNHLIEPPQHAGQSLNAGFRAWTEAMPPEDAEAALVLRRGVMVAGGRAVDPGQVARITEGLLPVGVCHSYQPGIRETAWRNVGSRRDFSASSDGMLSALQRIP